MLRTGRSSWNQNDEASKFLNSRHHFLLTVNENFSFPTFVKTTVKSRKPMGYRRVNVTFFPQWDHFQNMRVEFRSYCDESSRINVGWGKASQCTYGPFIIPFGIRISLSRNDKNASFFTRSFSNVLDINLHRTWSILTSCYWDKSEQIMWVNTCRGRCNMLLNTIDPTKSKPVHTTGTSISARTEPWCERHTNN